MHNALSRPILLTGFGPFDRWLENSSMLGARHVAAQSPERVVFVELTVDHAAAAAELEVALTKHRPAIALLSGQTSEECFRLERRARRTPDCPWAEGPGERYGAWPWEASLAAMATALAAPTRPRFSDDCGGFVCETAYRALLDHRARAGEEGPRLAIFMHTPPLSERWTVEHAAAAMTAALGAADAALPAR